jgi:hypothetical protein
MKEAQEMPAAHVMTPRVVSRTSAPPFEQRHQKSNMRQCGAKLAGASPVTLGGD